MIRCCAGKPAIETFFHFKAPRGFSGHRLNGRTGRGGGGREQVQPMGGAIPVAICFLFRGLGPCAPSDTPRGHTLPEPRLVAMAPRFGLTPAHVPSQSDDLAPLLASVEGRKKRRRRRMDGEEPCIGKRVKGRPPGHFCLVKQQQCCPVKPAGESLFLLM